MMDVVVIPIGEILYKAVAVGTTDQVVPLGIISNADDGCFIQCDWIDGKLITSEFVSVEHAAQCLFKKYRQVKKI